MTFPTGKFVSFDFETSGELPEYALQPWRITQGKAWATSLAWVWRPGNRLVAGGGLNPTVEMMRGLLEDCIANKRTLVGWNTAFDIAILIAYGLEELVMQCKFLDGVLLWRHFDLEPEYETDRSKKRSYGLKTYVKEHLKWMAGYEEEIDFHDPSPEARRKLHKYNVQDNIATFLGVEDLLAKLSPAQRRAAIIEAECLPLIARANHRGMVIDTLTTHDLQGTLAKTAVDQLAKLAEHGVTEKIVRSPIQLANLIYDQWGLPVLKENTGKKTGKISRATDKEVLHELAFLDPRALELRKYREALNNKTKFADALLVSADYNEDGCAHPQAICFGTYCVPGDVEVMTREGWVRLDAWAGGDIVQARPDLSLEFLPAERHIGAVEGDWVHVKQRAFDCMFTPGHTFPYLAQKSFNWRTTTAGALLESGETKYIPTAGRISLAGQITPDQMRVLAAIQADGSFVCKKYKGKPYAPDLKFTLKKPRKIARIKELLRLCGVPFREYATPAYPGRVEIITTRSSLPNWVSPARKVFGPWVLDTTMEGLEALVDEVVHWDGSVHPDGGVKYSSSIKQNVEWVVTAAALVGRKASTHDGGPPQYSCHLSDHDRAYKSVNPNYVTASKTEQRAYCTVTETGFWLARSKGHIFITGNSGRLTYSSSQGTGKAKRQTGFALHQEKNDKKFRSAVTVPQGYTLMEFDAAGQEFRWMGIASGDDVMLNLCAPGEDPHSYMASRICDRDYRELISLVHLEDALAAADRKLGKVANLSLQYRTSARKLRVVARVQYNLPMEMPQAQRIHATYQRAYPGVPRYWNRQIYDTKRSGYVETFAGRRVRVVGDWDGRSGWSMASTAINYRIQGTGADQKYLAMAVIKPYLTRIGAYFAWDLHDGIYLYVPTHMVQQAAIEIKRLLDNLPYRQAWGFTPPIPLPWDVKAGPSWGALKEVKL